MPLEGKIVHEIQPSDSQLTKTDFRTRTQLKKLYFSNFVTENIKKRVLKDGKGKASMEF